jgi:biotin carboxyl carrier protein
VDYPAELADVVQPPPRVTRTGDGTYLVVHDGRHEIVHVAGAESDRWIFWNGHVFRRDVGEDAATGTGGSGPSHKGASQLTAPMPARVIRILAAPGATVQKGATLVVLEAMKMELPLRAPANATVAEVHCREGEMVAADAVLIDLK